MIRRGLLWLLVIGFAWLVVTRLAQIEKLVNTLVQGQWQWILLAVILQVLYYLIYAALYKAGFATVRVQSRVRDLISVTFASIFVNVVAPSGGASGAALFVDDASRRDQSATRAAVGTILVLIAEFSAFALILIVGLLVLFTQHDLQLYEIVAAAILLIGTAVLVGMLLLGMWHPGQLQQLLSWFQRSVNRLGRWVRRPQILSSTWAETNATEFTVAAQAMVDRPWDVVRTLAVALVVQLINLTTLYVLFLAFQYHITFGPLVAGYSIAILFLIVSPTPMGIGFVEGVTPLVLISLGVPAGIATVVILTFRGLSFWLPLLIGFLLIQRIKTFSAGEQAQARAWNIKVVALLTGGMGVINILSAVTPALAGRIHMVAQYSPLLVRHGGHLTAALSGFALLLLAAGLWRYKQTAWLLTMVVLVISVISHLLKGLDYEEALLAAGLAVWLFALRSHFHALSDPPSIKRGLSVLVVALLFTLAYGTIGFFLLDRHFSVNFDFETALRQTVVMFTQFYDPGLEPVTGFGRYFAGSIYVVGAITVGYAFIVLLRPVVQRRTASVEERRRAQAIVAAYGQSAVARMTLFADKAYWFSPGGSVVAYAARGRAAVALGDPIGPPADALAAIDGFKDYCTHHDWYAAFYQTRPDNLEHYTTAGFDTLHIGDEGIVCLAKFSLSGKVNRTRRSTINRLAKMGYQAKVHQPPLPADLLEELREISDEWLTMMHGREKRFSLGWFDDNYIRSGPVIAISTPAGVICAFANIVPEYQRNEITIDLMRRKSEVESGVMEFLFVSLFGWARGQQYDSVNLGMSPLAGVGAHPDDPRLERALHFIYEHVNQFYNFKGLHGFKEKFHPDWSPRYLVYPGPASLPAIAMALNRASSGDSFLFDYARDLVERWRGLG